MGKAARNSRELVEGCPLLRNREKLPSAVVLAGGLGTRLRTAYAGGPKSMAPVGKRPFLDYLLSWLRSQGVEKVVICVGYKRSQIQRFVGRGRKWGLRVTFSVERKLLGTGGALKKAENLISGDRVLVVNGDTFVDINVQELIKFHEGRKALATLAAVNVADSGRYGSLGVDGENKITAFFEKITRNGARQTGKHLINGGVYVFQKEVLKEIYAHDSVSLEREVLPLLVQQNCMYAFESNSYFLDIGVPEDLWRAQLELPERIRISHTR